MYHKKENVIAKFEIIIKERKKELIFMPFISRSEYNRNLKKCMDNIQQVLTTTNITECDELNRYIASYEEIDRVAGEIINKYLNKDTLTVEKTPKISINVAPQASGKSLLNSYAVERLNYNCVLINSDELKKYYPCANEIAHKSSKISTVYSYATDIGSNLFTSALLNKALKNGYNIVFEGTGRTNNILNTIAKYQSYRVKVRTLAVSAETSLSYIMLRYIEQYVSGCNCRLVRINDFLQAFNNIPCLIREAEKAGFVVEIFTRGTEKNKSPIKLYNSRDRKGFYDAVAALEYAREASYRIMHEENINRLSSIHEFVKTTEIAPQTLIEFINIFYSILKMTDIPNNEYDF